MFPRERVGRRPLVVVVICAGWPMRWCSANEQEIKPHKVRYYLERRDPEFKQKMAEVLCVYREVRLIKETAAAAKTRTERCGGDCLLR